MSVLQVRSRDELRDEVVRFASELGFDTVAATAVVDHPLAQPEFISVDNTPPAYHDAFFDRRTAPRRSGDAALQAQEHADHLGPDDLHPRRARASCGSTRRASAIATASRWRCTCPKAATSFSASTATSRSRRHDELTRLVADLQLFAVQRRTPPCASLPPPPDAPASPSLTPRELESLRWTMEGKTAWEVGSVLGISESTAVLHVNNAMHKLGCVNKHQAVLKALRLGLIR